MWNSIISAVNMITFANADSINMDDIFAPHASQDGDKITAITTGLATALQL